MNILEALEAKSKMLPDKYKNMSVQELEDMIKGIKEKMGKKLFIPGHHYQKDEVIQFADATGDSLKLASCRQRTGKRNILCSAASISWLRRQIF